MAQKKKASNRSPKKPSDGLRKVTRITATDTKASSKASAATKTKSKQETPAAPKAKKDTPTRAEGGNPVVAIGGYFKGSWAELRQVRWPNRRTTWGLTLAVLVFTAFFVVIITLLDYVFQLLFERILG